MILEVYDKVGFIRSIKGTFKDGIFTWDEGNWLNHSFKTTPIDFDKTLIIKNKRVAFVFYTGKDYKQIPFPFQDTDKIDQEKSFRDFVLDEERTYEIKQRMLTKPRERLKDILEFLMFVLIMAGIFGIYFMVRDISQTYAPLLHGLNATLQQNQLQLQIAQNQTASLIKLIKALPITTIK